MKIRTVILFLSVMFACLVFPVSARNRQYTEKNPLIYEDSRSMWPFSFINDCGEPDGFNVELVRDVMKRLGIPLSIRLSSIQSAREDLHNDNANLFVGMKNNDNASYGQFGHSAITNVSSSVIVPRKDSLSASRILISENIKFAVRRGSFAHKYLERYGLHPNMLPMDNIDAVIREVSVRDSGAVVWSTASLAWIRDRYHLDNLVVVNVDLPEEELHFMSNDENLLHRTDSVMEIIRNDGTLAQLERKWFHADIAQSESLFNLSGVVIMLAVFAGFIVVANGVLYYFRRRIVHRLEDAILQMQLTLTASRAKVWVYNPFDHCFSWMNNKGETAEIYSEEEFRRFYPADEFSIILKHVHKFLGNHLAPVTIDIRGYSLHDSNETLPMHVHMEAMRTEYKRIYLIVGVQYFSEQELHYSF